MMQVLKMASGDTVLTTDGCVTVALVVTHLHRSSSVTRWSLQKDSNNVTSGLFFEKLLFSRVANFSHKSVLHNSCFGYHFILKFMSRHDDV